MSQAAIARPDTNEYAPYYGQYIGLVPEGDIIEILSQQLADTLSLFNSFSEEQGNTSYAPGKWSIKEILGHLIDAERIMFYRLLRIGYNDQTPIEGFEQDDYVREANFNTCKLADLVAEFQAVRQANLHLLRRLSPAAWVRRGVANNKEVSVRSLVYIVAGHERHHINILRTQYLIASVTEW